MKRRATARLGADPFDVVSTVGGDLPGVEAGVKYDGSPVLRLRGCFMAGLAAHPSAEPATLVVRIAPEDRPALLADAPDTYYLTDYYVRHPVVLARLARLDVAALRDLLAMAWRVTDAKAPPSARARGRSAATRP
jgi:hypothetical protein